MIKIGTNKKTSNPEVKLKIDTPVKLVKSKSNSSDKSKKDPLQSKTIIDTPEANNAEILTQPDEFASRDFQSRIYDSLKELEVINEKKLTEVYEESIKNKTSFQESLLEKDLISDVDLGKTVADLLNLPFISLSSVKIPANLTYLISESYAKTHSVIAFDENENEIKIAMIKPSNNPKIKEFIEQKSQKQVSIYYTTQRDFERALKVYKQNLQLSYDQLLKEQVNIIGNDADMEAPIEKIVDILIEYAYDNEASDIHIEPSKEGSTVRFRIDGVMQEVLHFSKDVDRQVISRIKFLSKLRTDEHLSAQDGKIRKKLESEDLDIRVSIVPIEHGEKCVMRLLSARYRQFGLDTLGMNKTDLKKVIDASNKPFGMILSTGPTGSGKSTTMYSILKILNTKDRNIETIEDPIEYELAGINQIQVNPKTNLTFAEGLRSILRQDPNIIFVGEIRDNETADIAVNSAMTGHLVLSTLHTNDASTALPRLLDMDIEPYLVASTINIVIGQRLIRKICDKCKFSQSKNIEELEKHFDKKLVQKYFGNSNSVRLYKGKGCPVCRTSGYSGRIGIFEILLISDKIKDLIVDKNDAQKIRDQAIREEMTTMMEDGLSKIQQGLTTVDEVVRATIE